MTPEEHQIAAVEYIKHAERYMPGCGYRNFSATELIALAQVHATLANGVAAQKLDEANAALDKIAEYATPNDGAGWSDVSGLLESIGNTIERTGRTINWEGDY